MTQQRDSQGRFKPASDTTTRNRSIGGAALIGALAAGAAAAWRYGVFDRLFAGKQGHAAPDLALDQDAPTGQRRAPDAFRPDPAAPVPASEREALRPPATVKKGFIADRHVESLVDAD